MCVTGDTIHQNYKQTFALEWRFMSISMLLAVQNVLENIAWSKGRQYFHFKTCRNVSDPKIIVFQKTIWKYYFIVQEMIKIKTK